MKTINIEDYASAIELNTPYQVMPVALEVNEALGKCFGASLSLRWQQ